MSYCSIADARSAGAHGSDDAIELAIAGAEDLIDRYCRSRFEPTSLDQLISVGADGIGRFPLPTSAVAEGELLGDNGLWRAPSFGPAEWLVSTTAGEAEVPVTVSVVAARLAAMLAPAAFTAQADAEGQPIGRPPAPAISDETDPGPTGAAPDEAPHTTGDKIADEMLTPYRRNVVMIS